MKLSDIINNNVRALDKNDSIGHALDEFEKYGYDFLPVLSNGELVCCLHREAIIDHSDFEIIQDVIQCEDLFFANIELSIFDVMRLFAINATNILPVVDLERKYLGTVLVEDLLNQIGNTPFVLEKGGVLIVRKSMREYSISEIANIVESENAKILGILTSDFVDNDIVLTIKINQMRLANIETALKRFGYSIVDSYYENKNFNNLQDRYNQLMNYLDI